LLFSENCFEELVHWLGKIVNSDFFVLIYAKN